MSADGAPPGSAPRAFGDHDVVRLIAQGGMGAVFEVVNRRTGAATRPRRSCRPSDAKARARFEREAELLARCDRHPGIVKVHASGRRPTAPPT